MESASCPPSQRHAAAHAAPALKGGPAPAPAASRGRVQRRGLQRCKAGIELQELLVGGAVVSAATAALVLGLKVRRRRQRGQVAAFLASTGAQ